MPLAAFLPLFLTAVGSDDGEHCPVFHPPQGFWTWAGVCPGRFRRGGALEGKKTSLNATKERAWEKVE